MDPGFLTWIDTHEPGEGMCVCVCVCVCVGGFSGSFNPSSHLNTYLCQRSQIHFSPDMLIPLMNLRYCKCLTESLRGSECDGADGQTNIGGGKIIWAADSRDGSANYVYSSQSKDVGSASGLSEHFVFGLQKHKNVYMEIILHLFLQNHKYNKTVSLCRSFMLESPTTYYLENILVRV